MVVSGQRAPALLQRGVSQATTLTVYGSASPTVSSGTYTLYDPVGDVVTTGAITASGATASYTLTPSGSLDYGAGYREEWALILSDSSTPTFLRPAILGRLPVLSTVQPGDLSALDRRLPGVCAFTDPDGDPVTWLSYAWEKLDITWSDILRRLAQAGRLPTRILSLDLHDYHRALTFQVIYEELTAISGDLYDRRLADAKARVLQLEAGAALHYDMDDDGIDDMILIGVGSTPNRVNVAAGWPWGIV